MHQTLHISRSSHVPSVRLTQALHNVLGPIGPLLHSGVSVAPQPRHLGVFLSPFKPLGAGRLFALEDVLALSGTEAGSELLIGKLLWPCG